MEVFRLRLKKIKWRKASLSKAFGGGKKMRKKCVAASTTLDRSDTLPSCWIQINTELYNWSALHNPLTGFDTSQLPVRKMSIFEARGGNVAENILVVRTVLYLCDSSPNRLIQTKFLRAVQTSFFSPPTSWDLAQAVVYKAPLYLPSFPLLWYMLEWRWGGNLEETTSSTL